MIARADVIGLQVTDIPGDSKFAANNGLPPDSIRVLTVGNSVENTTDCIGGGSCTGKANFSHLQVIKKFGESSPPLFLAVAQGNHFPRATISFYRLKQGVPSKYFTILLTDVVINSQSWVGNASDPDSSDSESLQLGYSRIELRDEVTGSRACFDVSRAVSC